MRPLSSTWVTVILGALAVANAEQGNNWEQNPIGSDDATSQELVSFEPCNDFPEYCELPIDWSVWLGATGSGSSSIEKGLTLKDGEWIESVGDATSLSRTQTRTVTSMLNDGIRLLKVDLCSNHGEPAHVCFSDGENIGYGATLKSFLRDSFQFLKDQPHQALVLHLEENPMNSVDIRQVEKVIDDVCAELSNRTAGVFWFEAGQCPWIYTKKEISTPLPTMGELVGFDPEMAQWEGDGELVGVRSQLIVTHSQEFIRPYGYKSNYMSQPFWQTTHGVSQDISQVKAQLKKLCSKATAIEVEVSIAEVLSDCVDNGKCADAGTMDALNDALYSRQGCNIETMSNYARIAAISTSFYHTKLEQIKGIQRKLLQLNEKKLSAIKLSHQQPGNSKPKNQASHHDEL
ncbi:hypothetical protein K450DRAFT_262995 [Umbelopsis ramanniana AG]|uniref:Uncharacterized protein n=1 Tax=Umbelopsis ramanniana AG TaxID=1314678 RepID=A0AAD5E2B7_UMBRA|nr:uncharacterized protein K450DRAFT_262995 [Umbelopsis ramanniana AG]KAI8575195.1 hypothetical protein K450DRAFT_262995 [Umbelopsis ramanniana AG]